MNNNNNNDYNFVPMEETCFLCHRLRPLDAGMQFLPFVRHGICSSCWSNYIKYGHRIKQLKQEEEEEEGHLSS
ncbi:MAG: hypothetical protein ACM3VV_04245 [Deltaproteobacteria bacterium]